MNEEQKYPSEEALNLDAGKDKFERSEYLSFPAWPPAEPGVPPWAVSGAPTSGGFDPNEAWQEVWPAAPAPQSTDEVAGLPDSLSWAEDAPLPPSLKARRRGTLSKSVERPLMPLSPPQMLLLLDTCCGAACRRGILARW